jgi:uncharacterized protein YcnI
MPSTTRALGLLATATIAGVVTAGPAAAHVSPDKGEVVAGEFTAVTLTVGHGCDASPTTRVEIQVPESILNVTPEIEPGWAVEVTTEALPEPVAGPHGEEVTERDALVTYTADAGGELPDGFRTGFTLGFQAPDTPGEALLFKTIQTCAEGETAWIEEIVEGEEEPEHPSPVVRVVEAAEAAAQPEDEDVEAASAAAASAAADEQGDDDDGAATGLAVAGLVAGLLGLALGGSAFARSRR